MPFQPLGGGAVSMPTIQGAPTVNPLAGLSQIMQLVSMASLLQNRAQQQEMNQMRMAMWQQQMEDGKTEADKKRILRDRYLKDYAMRVVTNPDFRTEYSNVLRLSPGRQEKEFKKLHDKYIEPLKYNYDNTIVKPKDVYDYLLYDKILDARQKAKAIDDSRWSGLWDSIVADAAHLGASAANTLSFLPGIDARSLAQWATEQKQKAVAKNLWLQDQERRAQQGEGFLDQSVSDMARTILGSVPSLAGFIGATAAGTAVGGPIGGLTALGRAAGGALGGALATGALGGAMSDIDYAAAINSSQLSEAEKEAAMSGLERYGNAAVGTAFGALAPSIARPYRAVRGALSKSYTPMALPTSRLAAVARQGIDTAAGMGLMGAGQQAASNIALGSVLNQDIPWYRGTLDAAAQSAIPGLFMGGYFGRRNPIKPPTESPDTNLRRPPTTPTPPGTPNPGTPNPNNGGVGKNLETPPENVNATPEEAAPVSKNVDVEAAADARKQLIIDRINASKDADVQQFAQMLAKEMPIDAILADTSVAPRIKKLLGFDSSQEPAIEIKDGSFKSLAKTKSDKMVEKKIVHLLSNKLGNEGAPAEKAILVKTIYDRLREKLATPEQYGLDAEQATRLSKLADKAYQTALKENKLEMEGALIEYGEKARQKVAQTQPEGGSPNIGSGNSVDSRTSASTRTTTPESTAGTTSSPGEVRSPIEGGVVNGTSTPTDGANQTLNGANQGEGTLTGGETPGRAGKSPVGSTQTNAGAGKPNAQAREQPSSGQSESGLSGSNADRIDKIRRMFAANNINNGAASTAIGLAARTGNNNNYVYAADAKMIYSEVEKSSLIRPGQKLADLPENVQDTLIKAYLDAYDTNAREQTNSGQSESGLSEHAAERINMYRSIWAANDIDNDKASKAIGYTARNGDDSNPVWTADARMIYRIVEESPFNNADKKLSELPEAEQDAIIKTYLDAYNEKETAENATPTDTVCP